MTDILGPGSNATNVTTTRPADSRIMASIDTWLQDCTSSTAQDGTEISAEFLNGVLANLRVLARGNGPQISGGPVVPEDNSDLMLLNAALHLIQRGKMHVATDAGGVNALVAQLSPVPPELVDGMLIVMRPAIANTGPTTFTAAGVTNQVATATGAPLGGGELNPSLFSAFRWNVTLGKWQLGDSVPEAALVHFGADTSAAANTIIANVTPAISSYKPGMLFFGSGRQSQHRLVAGQFQRPRPQKYRPQQQRRRAFRRRNEQHWRLYCAVPL
ncbi:protein of unknown function [Methylocella tundrae]|uniref:Uncharacterized protein n=1 Tax=Methylocella tundrae TaxID=227605 RepID=A0A4U8YX68_METTU|nr:hypothetical protein [Methylocella tundrae]VFU07946.1 protein of unknown function [Methylocella tundrae]